MVPIGTGDFFFESQCHGWLPVSGFWLQAPGATPMWFVAPTSGRAKHHTPKVQGVTFMGKKRETWDRDRVQLWEKSGKETKT